LQAVFEVPVTVQVKDCVPPVATEAVAGVTAIVTDGVALTVTVAWALLVGSAWLVTTTWYVPAAEGAVYTPAAVTEPPAEPSWTDQVTLRLDALTVTADAVPSGPELVPDDGAAPPQAKSNVLAIASQLHPEAIRIRLRCRGDETAPIVPGLRYRQVGYSIKVRVYDIALQIRRRQAKCPRLWKLQDRAITREVR
jgi:hypothetical protein